MGNQQQNCNLLYSGKVLKSEHLYSLYNEYIQGSSLRELSSEYGYNIGTIRNFLKRNKVKIRGVKESVEKFHKIPIIKVDDYLEQNLVGWILGDGGLRLSNHSINPYFHYTDKHFEYINYVGNILNSYNIKYNITQNKTSKCYQLQTESRPEFHKYYNIFYGYEGLNENGQKRKILPDIALTPIILNNWYVGDGSSHRQSKSYNYIGTITCKYKNDFIIDQLNDICRVNCYKDETSYKYVFNNKRFIEFLKYIGNCPVECYKYKWITRCSTTIIETSKIR